MTVKASCIKAIALLALNLGLVSCADYYETGYRYPRTRSYTQINTYRYNPPTVVYPAPRYPTDTSPDSNYSIRNQYEINQNYYSYPSDPHEEEHHHHDYDDDFRRDNRFVNPDNGDEHPPYAGRQHPFINHDNNAETGRHRGYRNRDIEPGQPQGRTYGQQEYDKVMERLRQHQPPSPREQIQQPLDRSNPVPHVQERLAPTPPMQQAPDRQRPAFREKLHNRGTGENRPGAFQSPPPAP